MRSRGAGFEIRTLHPGGEANPTAIEIDGEGEVLVADGIRGELFRLELPADASAAWRPVPAVVGTWTVEALRERAMFAAMSADAARNELHHMRLSPRWRATQWLVDIYDALGRPFDSRAAAAKAD